MPAQIFGAFRQYGTPFARLRGRIELREMRNIVSAIAGGETGFANNAPNWKLTREQGIGVSYSSLKYGHELMVAGIGQTWSRYPIWLMPVWLISAEILAEIRRFAGKDDFRGSGVFGN
ncbi:MAG: hypothetical protein OXT06_15210 [Rhodospirillaceae bacterium]|nr:hypothetical protein [Rhodospirillaceae bacterium]MDD9914492.1 hypothetical protein [Rhodospirillaceae bacterium]MDD9924461.1 hypothetical protein [Rhodospirillaceae bacterium]